MHDSRPAFPTRIGEILEVIQERVRNRSASDAGTGVHDKSGGFLDHGKIGIFEVDLERDLLGSERSPFDSIQVDFNSLGAANAITGFFVTALDVDRSRPVEMLDLRTRHVF